MSVDDEWLDVEILNDTLNKIEENIKAMRDNMSAEDIKAFDDFLDIAWR